MEEKSKVYVLVDEQDRILRCEGGHTMRNIENVEQWVLVDEGEGGKYDRCQAAYFAGGLYTEDGIPKYKLLDGKPAERSAEEMEADRAATPAPAPTQLDIIEAQVVYTAMMTDTFLEV